MIGKILRDKPSCFSNQYFFKEGDIVSCGYHDNDGEPSQDESCYLWAETFGWNPSSSLDFLTADDDIEIISHLDWQEYSKQSENETTND